MVLHHVENLKLLNRNHLIAFGILLRHFEVMVAALAFDLQMRVRCALRGTASAMRAFLAAADGALFASESSLRRAIITRVLHRVPFRVRQERLQADINPDIRVSTGAWRMFVLWIS